MNVFNRKPFKKTESEQIVFDRRKKLMALARKGDRQGIRDLKKEFGMYIFTRAEREAYEQDGI